MRIPFGTFAIRLLGVDPFPKVESTHFKIGLTHYKQSNRDIQMELVIGEMPRVCPGGVYTVDGCSAAIGRILVKSNSIKLSTSCLWCDMDSNTKGGPDPGEHLDAVTWTHGEHTITLGTDDAERKTWLEGFHDFSKLRLRAEEIETEYQSTGLVNPTRQLNAGNFYEFHYVVAWKIHQSEFEPAT